MNDDGSWRWSWWWWWWWWSSSEMSRSWSELWMGCFDSLLDDLGSLDWDWRMRVEWSDDDEDGCCWWLMNVLVKVWDEDLSECHSLLELVDRLVWWSFAWMAGVVDDDEVLWRCCGSSSLLWLDSISLFIFPSSLSLSLSLTLWDSSEYSWCSGMIDGTRVVDGW